jgi:hypothetical protein
VDKNLDFSPGKGKLSVADYDFLIQASFRFFKEYEGI